MDDEYADEPKPKRRSALRHALGGLALLACIALGMWLIEERGWTNWGEWSRRTWLNFTGESRAKRNRIEVGQSWTEVRSQIGNGSGACFDIGPTGPRGESYRAVETYADLGFRVIYVPSNLASEKIPPEFTFKMPLVPLDGPNVHIEGWTAVAIEPLP